MDNADDAYGLQSPGGFIFGVQGWVWGEPRPRSITFFLDGTAKVCDQHGRPIKGTVIDNREVRFAMTAPTGEDYPDSRTGLANHQQVIAALAAERIDWRTLVCAGWPQLPYDQLVAAYGPSYARLPMTPLEELRKIKDSLLRRDAMRLRREVDDLRMKESIAITSSDEG